jgi:hypothetical protein
VVDHGQLRGGAEPFDSDLDRLAGAELGRVAEQVGHHLIEPRRIPSPDDRRRTRDRHRGPRRDEIGLDVVHRFAHDRVER